MCLNNGTRGSATLTMVKHCSTHHFKINTCSQQAFDVNFIDVGSFTSSETVTLHLPDFKWGHLIGALNQMLPEFLQLFLKFRIIGPDKYNVLLRYTVM